MGGHDLILAASALGDPESPISVAVAYKGYQKFWDENSHAPGEDDAKLEADESQVVQYIREYLDTVWKTAGRGESYKGDGDEKDQLWAKWAKEL